MLTRIKFLLFFAVVSTAFKLDNLKTKSEKENEICNTPDCVMAAHSLIQNMDTSVDPCDDFYQYACGNFVERVSFLTNNYRINQNSPVF